MNTLLPMEPQPVGEPFQRRINRKNRIGEQVWFSKFLCQCGKEFTSRISNVRSGKTKSCGCKSSRYRENRVLKHGMAGTATYEIWAGMKGRCLNQNDDAFDRYGGRGITVCERWMTFENFFADMGERPEGYSLDRINNDGNYEPDNCRWATKTQQADNKRHTRHITINGETHTITEWAKLRAIDKRVIHKRLKRGWSELDAVLGKGIK